MRPLSLECNWLKCRSFSRTAVNNFTGIVTSPKLIVPFQIACAIIGVLPPARMFYLSSGGCRNLSSNARSGGVARMRKRDPIRTLCDDIWEELFEAIDAAACL